MSTENKAQTPDVRYGGYLSDSDKVKDGVSYTYNWARVTHKADLEKRSAEFKKAEKETPDPAK